MMQPSSEAYPISDLESSSRSLHSREQTAQDILTNVGTLLNNASNLIDDLERDQSLGPAITRFCNDLADGVGELAKELEDQDESERRMWARALVDDAREELALTEEVTRSGNESKEGAVVVASRSDPAEEMTERVVTEASRAMSSLSEEDIMTALDGAHSILVDVESALRSVGQDEADEIADVALAVARMFLWSLESVHAGITPQQLAGTEEERRLMEGKSRDIEFLDDEETQRNGSRSISSGSRTEAPKRNDRLRVLWPPIGPALASAADWGRDAASKEPLLSIALGMALWPAALVGTFVGAPIVAADWVLQTGYDAAKDGPIVETVEKGAANLYNVGKLYFLCGKLVVKQGLRVGERQIKRRGGVGQVAADLGGLAIDRALHPVETACMAWDGVKWGAGVVRDAGVFVKEVATGEVEVGGVGGPAPTHMH